MCPHTLHIEFWILRCKYASGSDRLKGEGQPLMDDADPEGMLHVRALKVALTTVIDMPLKHNK